MSGPNAGRAEIDSWLVERLICPVTRTPLRLDRGSGELVSDAGRLAYPVRDGVPVLLAEEARHLGNQHLLPY